MIQVFINFAAILIDLDSIVTLSDLSTTATGSVFYVWYFIYALSIQKFSFYLNLKCQKIMFLLMGLDVAPLLRYYVAPLNYRCLFGHDYLHLHNCIQILFE